MRCQILIIVLLLLLSVSVVSAQTYEDKESLIILQTVDNIINLVSTGGSYQVNQIEARYTTRPLETYRQTIEYLETNPQAEILDESIFFEWNNPSSNSVSAQIEAQVETLGISVPIKTKINFPLTNIPSEVQDYLQSTDSIDSNQNIAQLASSLAGDETDLFMVEFVLADWVNRNIEYDLSTLTSEANQPSSWVLENKYGVCDEITNLFISLNRALGVPARFVSGIAYTDSELFDENWGNHGWSEVYFPSVGWVPYDVTYQQYGYIDATHIAIEKGVDGTGSSAEYSASGYDFQIQPEQLDFETSIVSEGNDLSERTTISVSAIEDEVGFGSYNVIKATVKNKYNHYAVERLISSQTTNLESITPNQQMVALKPREEKTVYWLVKIDNNLQDEFVYSFPVSISRSIGPSVETVFSVAAHNNIYSKEYMEQFMQNQYTIAEPLPILCQHNEPILLGDSAQVKCTLTESTSLSVCDNTNCKTLSSMEDSVSFDLNTNNVGFQTMKLYSPINDQSLYVTYKVNDMAKVKFGEISIPETFTYEQVGVLEVNIQRDSFATPNNISLILNHPLFTQEWSFEELISDQKINIELIGAQLKKGTNTFTISLRYLDNFGEEIVIEEIAETKLVNLTTGQSINIIGNSINGKLSKFLTTKVYNANTEEAKEKVQKQINLATIIIIAGLVLFVFIKAVGSFSKHREL